MFTTSPSTGSKTYDPSVKLRDITARYDICARSLSAGTYFLYGRFVQAVNTSGQPLLAF